MIVSWWLILLLLESLGREGPILCLGSGLVRVAVQCASGCPELYFVNGKHCSLVVILAWVGQVILCKSAGMPGPNLLLDTCIFLT